jgi:hypothetical protein
MQLVQTLTQDKGVRPRVMWPKMCRRKGRLSSVAWRVGPWKEVCMLWLEAGQGLWLLRRCWATTC